MLYGILQASAVRVHTALCVGRLIAWCLCAVELEMVQEGIMTVSYDGSLFTYSVPGLSHESEPRCPPKPDGSERIQHESENEE